VEGVVEKNEGEIGDNDDNNDEDEKE